MLDQELSRKISEAMIKFSGNKTAVARDVGCGRQTVIDHCKATGPPLPSADMSAPKERKFVESDDAADLSYTSDRRIRTVEDALAYGEVDTTIWKVDRFEVSSWEVALNRQVVGSDGKRLSDEPQVKTLWRVALKLRRKMPKPFQLADDAIFERLKAIAPTYQPAHYDIPADPHLLVVDLFDVHFGKLAWARETGQDYDLRIAERIFREAVEDILARASGYEIEKIVFPVGNDFFHVDSPKNETTNGTPQDTDGRYHKIIEVGELALIWAIEACRMVAPVEIVHVPGNHDKIASWHACRTLWGRFYSCPDVKVDFEPKTRKYIAYGKTLIGFTHGCDEKTDGLKGVMSDEVPQLWAASRYREWHRGHMHRAKSFQYNPVDTVDGIRIRDLQSLSGRDAWHYLKGYAGGKRAAEAFLYSKATGDVHSFEVSVRNAV